MSWADRVRLLDADRDEAALRSFQCALISEPWARSVQDAIQNDVADAVRRGRSTGFVCVDGGQLVGVGTLVDAIAADMSRIGYSSVLATSVTHRRQGVARALKLAVMEAARSRGYRFLESQVHEQNRAMLDLNRSLGADMRHQPPGPDWRRSDHISCVVAL